MLWDTRAPRDGGDEPWLHEPDRVAWIDAATGYRCLIVRNHTLLYLCGYVRVPRGHPMHGLSCWCKRVQRTQIDVHGGLTFSGRLRKRLTKRGHWFGFDCGHSADYAPGLTEVASELGPLNPELAEMVRHLQGPTCLYRTLDYVRSECTLLAEQLAQHAKDKR